MGGLEVNIITIYKWHIDTRESSHTGGLYNKRESSYTIGLEIKIITTLAS